MHFHTIAKVCLKYDQAFLYNICINIKSLLSSLNWPYIKTLIILMLITIEVSLDSKNRCFIKEFKVI